MIYVSVCMCVYIYIFTQVLQILGSRYFLGLCLPYILFLGGKKDSAKFL